MFKIAHRQHVNNCSFLQVKFKDNRLETNHPTDMIYPAAASLTAHTGVKATQLTRTMGGNQSPLEIVEVLTRPNRTPPITHIFRIHSTLIHHGRSFPLHRHRPLPTRRIPLNLPPAFCVCVWACVPGVTVPIRLKQTRPDRAIVSMGARRSAKSWALDCFPSRHTTRHTTKSYKKNVLPALWAVAFGLQSPPTTPVETSVMVVYNLFARYQTPWRHKPA